MAGEGPDTLAASPIPDLDGVVHATSDELDLVKLESADGPGMTPKAVQLDTGLHIPHAHSTIIGAGDENRKGGMLEGF